MSVIQSKHNPNSEESLSNQDFNKKLVEELQNRIADSSKGGRPEMVEQHKERGKLLPRERIEDLIDPDKKLPASVIPKWIGASVASESPW